MVHTNGTQGLEVIDGQQRLTVLFLLMWAFKNGKVTIDSEVKHPNLDIGFAHRPKAQNTLEAIANGMMTDLEDQQTHEEISNVYKEIPQLLNRELSNTGCTPDNFYDWKIIKENDVKMRYILFGKLVLI